MTTAEIGLPETFFKGPRSKLPRPVWGCHVILASGIFGVSFLIKHPSTKRQMQKISSWEILLKTTPRHTLCRQMARPNLRNACASRPNPCWKRRAKTAPRKNICGVKNGPAFYPVTPEGGLYGLSPEPPGREALAHRVTAAQYCTFLTPPQFFSARAEKT